MIYIKKREERSVMFILEHFIETKKDAEYQCATGLDDDIMVAKILLKRIKD